MKYLKLLVISLLLIFLRCNVLEKESPVNLTHALNLVDSVEVSGKTLYYITIYSNYPDYKPVAAINEGISCVDDVGRFMEVLESEILLSGNYSVLPIARGMTEFLLYMCRDDGLWYNFIDENGEINTSHVNSQADFGWWATRGIRGLTAAYFIFKQFPEERDLLDQIDKCLEITLKQMDTDLAIYPQKVTGEFGLVPAWLIKSAPDMNSELLLALCKLQRSGDFDLLPAIKQIAEGLIGFQYQNKGHPLNGMYFCWHNTWHAWGANQPTSLLKAYKLTNDSTLLNSVRIWADNFVPFLVEHNLPNEITLQTDGSYQLVELPQIAYGINALYSGIQTLADISGEDRYQRYAERVFRWFSGANLAKEQMYWPKTGITFDGINEDKIVNRNSGAESTIEGLLAQQRNYYRK
ncbi:MAG TPA: hypothetical protein PKV46_10045, partial [Candidatus Marinimicrobia bacterium]|nr:hypothetical protein [Candidatus Neomarinimicrobiota bacterium]